MVAPHDLGLYSAGGHFFRDCLGYKEVVDPPSNVSCASIAKITPPGVVTVTVRFRSKYVNESGGDYFIDALAFLIRVAMLALICFGVRKIVRTMCDV